MPNKAHDGFCRLTGDFGPLAKSHIIPDAFMQRLTDGPFREWGGSGRPLKRFTGWYDTNILSHRGEEIIARYDDHAAKVLLNAGWTYRRRRHPDHPDVLVDDFLPGKLYDIPDVDTKKLKLFGLSLLWRAAVSELDTFSHIRLRPSFLEHLRVRVLEGEAGRSDDIPVYLNLFDSSKELSKIAPIELKDRPFFYFFLDGVVCYVARGRNNMASKRLGAQLIGSQDETVTALCVSSEASAQHRYEVAMAHRLGDAHGNVFRGDYNRPYRKL